MHYDYLVDATGDACPLPLLKAKQQLNKMSVGECVKVIASDEASVRDFASFIELTAHDLTQPSIENTELHNFVYYIVKR